MKIGIININKEKGFTSHDVVNVVRRILRPVCPGIKAGHTGTLDPIATGVLPVCVGKATKAAGILQSADKTYSAVMRLGVITDTEDITGTVLEKRTVNCDEDTLKQAVSYFCGKQTQTPPMYSAVKINGRKLYEAARAGAYVEREPREIVIYKTEVTRFWGDGAEISVSCGKGVYIRTLIKDIGEKLGCGACMEELERIRTGAFDLSGSIKLGELKLLAQAGKLEEAITPLDTVFDYPKVTVTPMFDAPLRNGNPVPLPLTELCDTVCENGKYFVYDSSSTLAGIYTVSENCGKYMLKPEIMLILND